LQLLEAGNFEKNPLVSGSEPALSLESCQAI
jgi:hypothetical protein